MAERLAAALAGALILFSATFAPAADRLQGATETLADQRASAWFADMRKAHLTRLGLNGALRAARSEAASLERSVDDARARRQTVQEQIGPARVGMAQRLSAVIAAEHGGASARISAIRRAALRLQRPDWQAAELAWSSADPAPGELMARQGSLTSLIGDLSRRSDLVAALHDSLMKTSPIAAARSRYRAIIGSMAGLVATDDQGDGFNPRKADATSRALAAAPDAKSPRTLDIDWRDLVDDGRPATAQARGEPQPSRRSGWSTVLTSLLTDSVAVEAPKGVDHGVALEIGAARLVRAPQAGKIVYAGSFRSYGHLLIIDDGDGYHVLLAGLSHLDVAEGAVVQAGDPIGGIDGVSGGPGRLYIELRRNGVPLDPVPWLAAQADKVRG